MFTNPPWLFMHPQVNSYSDHYDRSCSERGSTFCALVFISICARLRICSKTSLYFYLFILIQNIPQENWLHSNVSWMHANFQKTIFYWVIIIRRMMKILFRKGECSIPQLACSPQNTQFKSVFSIIQKHWTKSVFSLLLVRAQTDYCSRLDLSILNVHSSQNVSLDLHCISKCAASWPPIIFAVIWSVGVCSTKW